MVYPASTMKSLWLTGVMALSLFVAPCLWLYACEITKRVSSSVSVLPSWHLRTVIAGLVMLIPLMLSTHSGTGFYNSTSPTTANQDLIIHTTMLAAVAIFLVQTGVYLKRCKDLLIDRTKENFQIFSNVDDPALNTLRILIVAVAANWLINALRVVNCVTPGDDSRWAALFAGLQVVIIAYVIVAVFKQEAGFKPQQQAIRDSLQRRPDNNDELVRGKYTHSTLSQEHKYRIRQKLIKAMQHEKCFVDNEINLPSLCERIQENQHHVSQTINESAYQNFYDLINQYRVEAAKELLLTRPKCSVIEVAYEVGFNSKSTFNSVFKRHAKMTPTQFRDGAQTQFATS